MNILERRLQRVAESFLENERLTSDLADVAAKVLLDWALACGNVIVSETVDMNEATAEEHTYPRLKATRRLMRIINKWVSRRQRLDLAASAHLLDQACQQATIIYNQTISPTQETQHSFLRNNQQTPNPELISNVRTFIEPNSSFTDHNL